jgi:hypothetical protein
VVDVAGYNYMFSRYDDDAKQYPDRVIVGSETAPTTLQQVWERVERIPNVIGDFIWAGWDYVGEAGIAVRQYNAGRRLFQPFPALLAGTPVIDITGHRQTQSYLNEIIWHRSPGPFLAVQPVDHAGEKQTRTWWRATNSLRSWSWDGCEGREAVVEVHADAPRVELRLNGTSLGARAITAKERYLATFTVPYRAGELVAIAYDAGGREVGRDTLVSAKGPLRLTLTPETMELRADGADLAYIPIELTDADGIFRPLADRQVSVSVSGAGALLGFGSAEAITEEGFAAAEHWTYQGRALAVVRAGHTPGQVTLTASAEGCEPVTVAIHVRAITTLSRD